MKKMINNPRNLNIILLCGCISFISSCDSLDDLLVVSNPSELQESTIDDPALTPTLINSIEGAMVDAYDYRIIWMGSMFTDQQRQKWRASLSSKSRYKLTSSIS